MRRPAAGRKDRDKFVSGKTKQNAVKSMVLTDAEGQVLFCSPVQPGSCADITRARQLGLVKLLADGPFLEILADAGYQGIGAQTGGRVVTPPHRKFKKNAPAWYEERHEQQRKAHSSRRIRVEHGIAHLKNWRSRPPPRPSRAHERHRPSGRRTALTPADRHPLPRPSGVNPVSTPDHDVPRLTMHEVVRSRCCQWHQRGSRA
ncbi:transposase family protein [Streptomyces tuirus]|uniref:transposase family protein n=1 Tax=Streptomyces tuirus TaxID=68278 RepID=UPI001E2838DE|nr:transposase family protein [Streptomyces tuirus]